MNEMGIYSNNWRVGNSGENSKKRLLKDGSLMGSNSRYMENEKNYINTGNKNLGGKNLEEKTSKEKQKYLLTLAHNK